MFMLDQIMRKYTQTNQGNISNIDKEYIIQSIYASNPELFKDPRFMMELIKDNPKYIIYDLSDDDNLYLIYIDIINEHLMSKNMPEYIASFFTDKLNKLLNEINSPQKPANGYYKIPHKYLFEGIRKSIILEKDIYDVIDSYFEYDCKRTEEFGKTIEKLYLDDTIDLYFSGVFPEYMKTIFYEGYQINYGGVLSRNFWNAHDVKKNFMSLLETIGHYRDGIVFAAVPKGDTQILGSDGIVGFYDVETPNGNNYEYLTYLLPQYIVGYTTESEDGATFTFNDVPISDRRVYANYGPADLSGYSSYDSLLESKIINSTNGKKR